MISSTMDIVTKFFTAHPEFKKATILEIGSLNDGGGTVRERLPKKVKYTGLDMSEGAIKKDVPDYYNNVDILMNAHDLLTKFTPGSFDIIMCFDTFEHDDQFWISWENMKTVVRRGGYLILGTPGRNCPYHAHPNDYWRFMEPAFRNYFFRDFEDVYIWTKPEETVENYHIGDDWTYGWGRKL